MLANPFWRRFFFDRGKLVILATLAGILAVAGLSTRAISEEKKVFAADKGPKTIDVSKYPKAYQERYKLFSKKCSHCHTLARPINTDFEPSKFEKYVKRMRHKNDSQIEGGDAERIWQFLVYDLKERKQAFWSKLPADEKTLAEESFKKVAAEK